LLKLIGRPATSAGAAVQFFVGVVGAPFALSIFGLPLLGAAVVTAGLATELTDSLGSLFSRVAFSLTAAATFFGGLVALVLGPFFLSGVLVRIMEWLYARAPN
jgi:hypothetical protein